MGLFVNVKLKSERKIRKEKERIAVQILLDFAEGRLSTEKFWEIYKNDETIRNVLIYNKKRPWGISTFDFETRKMIRIDKPTDGLHEFNPESLLDKVNIDKLQHKYELFVVVNRFFLSRKIAISKYNDDIIEYLFLHDLLPDWVNVKDVSYVQDIFSTAPNGLSKKEKESWCKLKIKDLFRYDFKEPKWIQEPEWPIIDNIPYVFSHQETAEEGFERYIFYNSQNKNEQIVIEQCE